MERTQSLQLGPYVHGRRQERRGRPISIKRARRRRGIGGGGVRGGRDAPVGARDWGRGGL